MAEPQRRVCGRRGFPIGAGCRSGARLRARFPPLARISHHEHKTPAIRAMPCEEDGDRGQTPPLRGEQWSRRTVEQLKGRDKPCRYILASDPGLVRVGEKCGLARSRPVADRQRRTRSAQRKRGGGERCPPQCCAMRGLFFAGEGEGCRRAED